jgi:hypothetical protein
MSDNANQEKQPFSPSTSVTIRTMASDLKALEMGGGEIMAPQPFNPFGEKTEKPAFADLILPGYTGPEKSIFNPAGAAAKNEEVVKIKSKTIIFIVLILAVIVGLGLFGYFVISPWLFSQ